MRAQTLGVSVSTLLLTVLPILTDSLSRPCYQLWPVLGIYVYNLIYLHPQPFKAGYHECSFYKWGPCSERPSCSLQIIDLRFGLSRALTPRFLSSPFCQTASQVLRRYLIEAWVKEWPKSVQFRQTEFHHHRQCRGHSGFVKEILKYQCWHGLSVCMKLSGSLI